MLNDDEHGDGQAHSGAGEILLDMRALEDAE
jgi:hypothetical protein